MFRRFMTVCGVVGTLVMAGDARAQQFTRVSVSSGGTQGNAASGGAVQSGDGKIVAFTSSADNLVPSDTNGSADVFVRDLAAHLTTRVSVASDGSEKTGISGAGAFATALTTHISPQNISLNQDGSVVAFTSQAPLDPADTNTCFGHNCTDIYVRDRTLNQTTRVSVASNNGQADGESEDPHVSGNGRYVVFTSVATNLVPGDLNGKADVFVRDRTTLTTTRISVSTTGTDLTDDSYSGRISADGQIVAFVSNAAAVPDADPIPCAGSSVPCSRAYVVDRSSNKITRIPLPVDAFVNSNTNGAWVRAVDLTPDGRFVALEIEAVMVNLISTQTMLAVYDRQTTRTEIYTTGSGSHAGDVHINDSGRFLSTPGGSVRLFPIGGIIFDRQTSSYLAASELPAEAFISTDFSAIQFSADGLRMLFATTSSHAADDTNGVADVYIQNRDLDNDGMPDAWETQYGLNPTDSTDGALDADGDGVTNLQEYLNGTHPKGTFKRYFAEGAANSFFTTRFGVFNPGDQPVTVLLEFLGANSLTRSYPLTLAAHAWSPVTLTEITGLQPDNSFSTVIEANGVVVADRSMSWDQSGYGSSAETSIEAPETTWYLAEGSTGGAFDLFYLLQNPGETLAHVTVNYLRPAPAPPIVKSYTVPPKSRLTIYVDTEGAELAGTDVSAKITSDQPILAERAMYFSTPTQPFAAGHEGAAVKAPATSWFLAEGATGSFFDLFLLLANAETNDAQVKVTYLLPFGAPVVKTYPVAAQSRLTINVDFEDPRLADTPVSTIVESTNGVPVIAERAMWWPSPNWYEAHLSAGSTTTGTRWALADGLVNNTPGSETDTYILIANTSATAGSVDVTLYLTDGTPKAKSFPLPANSRVNVQVSAEFPDVANLNLLGFAAVIQSSGPPIVVERAIYTNANGQVWAAGSEALGTKLQ